MKSSLGDKARLQHILYSIVEIEHYLENINIQQFLGNSEKRFATIKHIEIIGEAANALTNELKLANADVPWKAITGFRNISVHEYFGADFTIV